MQILPYANNMNPVSIFFWEMLQRGAAEDVKSTAASLSTSREKNCITTQFLNNKLIFKTKTKRSQLIAELS